MCSFKGNILANKKQNDDLAGSDRLRNTETSWSHVGHHRVLCWKYTVPTDTRGRQQRRWKH